MSILPKIREGCVCIPWWEIPIIWSWRSLTWAVVILGALDIAVIRMFGLASLSIETLILVVAVAVAVSAVYFTFLSLDRYNGQKKQAVEMQLTAAEEGRELTAIEKIECDKVEKFDRLFLIGIFAGVILSAVVAILADLAVGGYAGATSEDTVLYGIGSLVASICASVLVDQCCIGPVIAGSFRKKVSKLYEEATKSLKAVAGNGTSDSKAQVAALLEQIIASIKN